MREREALLLPWEAVAQTPGEAAGSFLRVGCEIGHRIPYARSIRPEVVTPSRSGGHLHDRAAALPKRLYATATVRSGRLWQVSADGRMCLKSARWTASSRRLSSATCRRSSATLRRSSTSSVARPRSAEPSCGHEARVRFLDASASGQGVTRGVAPPLVLRSSLASADQLLPPPARAVWHRLRASGPRSSTNRSRWPSLGPRWPRRSVGQATIRNSWCASATGRR